MSPRKKGKNDARNNYRISLRRFLEDEGVVESKRLSTFFISSRFFGKREREREREREGERERFLILTLFLFLLVPLLY